jgi:hypothetical protein
MATFETKVVRLVIEPHKDADTLEIALIGGYRAVVPKGQFKTGDLAAYIQEASIVPDEIIEEMGLTGRLAGSKHNRVKALRLRGIFSQGLVYPARSHWNEGDNVMDEMGIKNTSHLSLLNLKVKHSLFHMSIPSISILMTSKNTLIFSKMVKKSFSLKNFMALSLVLLLSFQKKQMKIILKIEPL